MQIQIEKSKTYVCEVGDKIVFKILSFGNLFQTRVGIFSG